MSEVKCLSVRQPHADHLVFGKKVIENRSWTTTHRGRIYIHASRFDPRPVQDEDCPVSDAVLGLWDRPAGAGMTGAIIGSVELFGISDPLTLQILHDTPLNASALAREDAAWLRPGQREGWLDRHRHLHKFAAGLTADDFERFVDGPHCWLVRDPQPLDKPIITGGKLKLWTFKVPESHRRHVA